MVHHAPVMGNATLAPLPPFLTPVRRRIPHDASPAMRRLYQSGYIVESFAHDALRAHYFSEAPLPAGAFEADFTYIATAPLIATFEDWFFDTFPNVHALLHLQSLHGLHAHAGCIRLYLSFFANLLDSDRLLDGGFDTFAIDSVDPNRRFAYDAARTGTVRV